MEKDAITDKTVFKLTNAQIASDIGDETAILNHAKGTYYGLSQVGSEVWSQMAAGPKSFEALLLRVLDNYEIDEKTARNDLRELLGDLITENLVEVYQ